MVKFIERECVRFCSYYVYTRIFNFKNTLVFPQFLDIPFDGSLLLKL